MFPTKSAYLSQVGYVNELSFYIFMFCCAAVFLIHLNVHVHAYIKISQEHRFLKNTLLSGSYWGVLQWRFSLEGSYILVNETIFI